MTAKYLQKIRSQADDWLSAAAFLNCIKLIIIDMWFQVSFFSAPTAIFKNLKNIWQALG